MPASPGTDVQTAWISILLVLPLLGVAALYFQKSENNPQHFLTAQLSAVLTFLASLGLLFTFSGDSGAGFRLVESYPWIPGLGATWKVGVDGISLWLVLLTTLLMPLAIRSTHGVDTPKRYRQFLMLLLGLETALIGVFVALDLILFYLFWEAVLIPMYFLIGIWGGQHRVNSAMKFFVYTMIGSLLMLVAIFALWHVSASKSFDYTILLTDPGITSLTAGQQWWLFGAFALAFAIKVPLFPVHTWLPDAHTDAPTAGSILLAGVLLKMGTYGLLRFNLPLFPLATPAWAPWLAALAIIGIIYAAWIAAAQTDIKRLVAYSSVSHMGFVVLGILAVNEIGATGATLQMINHGITTGALFMLVGFLYDRRHTREIAEFRGIIQVMPVFAICFWITLFASIGLPGLNGFPGEFMIFMGVAQQSREWMILSVTGVIWGAIYMLWLYQRVFLGKVDATSANARLTDLTPGELTAIVPLLALMVLLGLFSPVVTRSMGPSISHLIAFSTTNEFGQIPGRLAPKAAVTPTAEPADAAPVETDAAEVTDAVASGESASDAAATTDAEPIDTPTDTEPVADPESPVSDEAADADQPAGEGTNE
ncbi:MAG: NADH-quinone oxidoreductase subunit M [bacterium]|nr:NADH-quinone oxidoreductase subunit M [bacterium]